MPSKEFIAECNEALSWIGICLASTAIDFGPTDFPDDGGDAFCNDLYKYAYSYYQALFHFLHQDTKDEWSDRNREHVLRLRKEKLITATGLSHFHRQGRQLHFYLDQFRPPAPPDPSGFRSAVKMTQKTLDWLSGAYRFGKSVPTKWYELLTASDAFSTYMEKAQAYFYSEIACALLLDPNDRANSKCWSGLAFMADYYALNLKNEEWAPICKQHFAGYRDDAIRLRTRRKT